uniref:Uncharacterized protein n=1 Tax=Plectus sambesii TaxID=2011161 RepID=A0A914WYH9_9BILA
MEQQDDTVPVNEKRQSNQTSSTIKKPNRHEKNAAEKIDEILEHHEQDIGLFISKLEKRLKEKPNDKVFVSYRTFLVTLKELQQEPEIKMDDQEMYFARNFAHYIGIKMDQTLYPNLRLDSIGKQFLKLLSAISEFEKREVREVFKNLRSPNSSSEPSSVGGIFSGTMAGGTVASRRTIGDFHNIWRLLTSAPCNIRSEELSSNRQKLRKRYATSDSMETDGAAGTIYSTDAKDDESSNHSASPPPRASSLMQASSSISSPPRSNLASMDVNEPFFKYISSELSQLDELSQMKAKQEIHDIILKHRYKQK